MHLLCETMFTCRKNNILPVHLCILLDDVIHKEKVKAIEGIFFQCVFFKEKLVYTEWTKIKFTYVLHDLVISQIFKNACIKEVIHGALILSVPINIDNLHFDTDILILKIIYPHFLHDDIVIKLSEILSGAPRMQKTVEKKQEVEKPFFHIPAKLGDLTKEDPISFNHHGPLEPPSTVRGLKQSANVRHSHPISRPEKANVTFLSDSWYSQNLKCDFISDIQQRHVLVIFWYELSKGIQMQIKNIQIPPENLFSSITNYLDRVNTYLDEIAERTFRCITTNMEIQNRHLPQKFNSHFQIEFNCTHLISGMELARDFWILSVDRNSCVLKAMASHFLHKKKGRSSLSSNEFWADLIDCTTGKTLYGEKVRWQLNSETSLYSTFRKNQNISWELQPNCYALYMSENLKLYWVLPGGFCVSGTFKLKENDEFFFDWQFGMS